MTMDNTNAAEGGTTTSRRRLLPVLMPAIIFAAVAGLFLVALQKGDPSKLPSALLGRAAPLVDLPAVPGLAKGSEPVPGFATTAIGKGKPAVINFFASWCRPCAEEHPQLVALVKRSNVTLIGINNKDEPQNAIRFLKLHGNPYAAVGADSNGRAAIEWGVYGMPETFIVDGAGTVVFKHVGPITPEVLEQKILPELAKAGGTKGG
ncbi:MAG: DsbE family thiol:disulfide interchange protein [Hyphomicrobiaceae bacterium]